jgi:hypothetical protein
MRLKKKTTIITTTTSDLIGKVNWWFNELDSLGIKNKNDIGVVSNDKSSSSNKTKPVSSQELEDLTDDIKQSFIRDYKTCYSE